MLVLPILLLIDDFVLKEAIGTIWHYISKTLIVFQYLYPYNGTHCKKFNKLTIINRTNFYYPR